MPAPGENGTPTASCARLPFPTDLKQMSAEVLTNSGRPGRSNTFPKRAKVSGSEEAACGSGAALPNCELEVPQPALRPEEVAVYPLHKVVSLPEELGIRVILLVAQSARRGKRARP